MTVDRLRADDVALEALWTSLQADGGVPCPFLSWQWFSSLAEFSELVANVRVLVASQGGRPFGLVPVEWVREGPLRSLGIAGWKWLTPDHVDVVAATRHADVALAVLRHLLEARDWDLVDLDGLSRDGALARVAGKQFRPPLVAARRPEEIIAPLVALQGKSEDELLPGRKLRKRVRKDLIDAQRNGGGLTMESDPDAVVRSLEELMRLHSARYTNVATTFGTPSRRSFHQVAARRMAEAGMARMYRLTSGGSDIALEYDLLFGGRLYAYSAGMDPRGAGSPGVALTGQIILSAAAEGLKEYDMLRGDEPYKLRFTHDVRRDVRIRALRLTPKTLAVASKRVASARLGRRSSRQV